MEVSPALPDLSAISSTQPDLRFVGVHGPRDPSGIDHAQRLLAFATPCHEMVSLNNSVAPAMAATESAAIPVESPGNEVTPDMLGFLAQFDVAPGMGLRRTSFGTTTTRTAPAVLAVVAGEGEHVGRRPADSSRPRLPPESQAHPRPPRPSTALPLAGEPGSPMARERRVNYGRPAAPINSLTPAMNGPPVPAPPQTGTPSGASDDADTPASTQMARPCTMDEIARKRQLALIAKKRSLARQRLAQFREATAGDGSAPGSRDSGSGGGKQIVRAT